MNTVFAANLYDMVYFDKYIAKDMTLQMKNLDMYWDSSQGVTSAILTITRWLAGILDGRWIYPV